MTILTTVTAFTGQPRVSSRARAALHRRLHRRFGAHRDRCASADFLDNFKNFVLLLLMVFTPGARSTSSTTTWSPRSGSTSRRSTTRTGRYGGWNVAALSCYALGVLVQIPFLAQTLYTGPVTSCWAAPTSPGSWASWSPRRLLPARPPVEQSSAEDDLPAAHRHGRLTGLTIPLLPTHFTFHISRGAHDMTTTPTPSNSGPRPSPRRAAPSSTPWAGSRKAPCAC